MFESKQSFAVGEEKKDRNTADSTFVPGGRGSTAA